MDVKFLWVFAMTNSVPNEKHSENRWLVKCVEITEVTKENSGFSKKNPEKAIQREKKNMPLPAS